MYRAQPKASKLLSAKWQEKDHQIHLKKLKDIKSALNVKRPASYNHLKTKPKKNQMLEGKSRESFLMSVKLKRLFREVHWNREGKSHFARKNDQYPAKPQWDLPR